LLGADTHQGAEARLGIGALAATHCASPQITAYLALLERARSDCGARGIYAGSPVLAALALRQQDRGLCCELQAAECRALERAIAFYPRMRCDCSDGYQALSAHLPPPERRALVFIDPPYEEQGAELARAVAAIGTVLSRLANAVIALWYPIKDDRELNPWLARTGQGLAVPALIAELWIYPRDARVGLNGSGLLIVNPPYQLDAEMAQWLPELGAALGGTRQGGTQVQWIAHEQH
jgi:23S rRNA (adenine2030-N6)-methyltransferase